ncbi:unnamed protein product, partial [Mesorhabditis belari]|uniref:Beta-glucosidase n=1 Tax=Mesorhabditis belari TaxID=2138241 RepID=A0AAF3EMJ5_9BILA
MDESLPRNLHVFPKDFIWASATAAYQIEGGSEEGGETLSVWDHLRRIPGCIKDNSDSNLSCEGFKHWKQDVQLLKALGVTHYRFSVSWSRILPTGKTDKINEQGVEFYRNLCLELKANGIEPIITMFHYDFPIQLHEEGGFLNRKSIAWFTDFARICFEKFGDLVKTWVTFNEIIPNASFGVVPMENLPKFALDPVIPLEQWNITKRQAPYLAAHHQILAHASVYRLYKEEFYSKQKGKIGIVSGGRAAETPDESKESLEAAKRMINWQFLWMNEPIFGDYPKIMRDRMDYLAEKEGLKEILPKFTDEERKMVKDSADFIGINWYLSLMVGKYRNDPSNSFMENDGDYSFYSDNNEKISGDHWLRNTPNGLIECFKTIRDNYGNVPILVSENGCADHLPVQILGDPLNDYHRIRYIRAHVEAIGKAIADDLNIIGYTAWSLMDNFEWEDGFAVRFGLYRVDFDSPEKTRTPKKSAFFYRNLIDEQKKIVEKTEL